MAVPPVVPATQVPAAVFDAISDQASVALMTPAVPFVGVDAIYIGEVDALALHRNVASNVELTEGVGVVSSHTERNPPPKTMYPCPNADDAASARPRTELIINFFMLLCFLVSCLSVKFTELQMYLCM